MSRPRVKLLRPRIAEAPSRFEIAKPVALRHTSRGAWSALRARILTRDCGLCQPCKREGKLKLAREVDHLTPVVHGGTDAEGNLQAICIPCHKAKTLAEASARARGMAFGYVER